MYTFDGPFIYFKTYVYIFAVLLVFLNCYSATASNKVQIFFTGAKLLALVIIIIGGFVKLGQGETNIKLQPLMYKRSTPCKDHFVYKDLFVIHITTLHKDLYLYNVYIYKDQLLTLTMLHILKEPLV